MPARPDIPACTAYDAVPYYHPYGYQPSLAAGITFSIIFGAIFITQAVRTIRNRAWWQAFFVAGAGLETLGWIARTLAHNCSFSSTYYSMQISTLIMVCFSAKNAQLLDREANKTIQGPAWTQVGVYISIWYILRILGRRCSPVPPTTYLLIIFWVDLVCLVLQAIGGGIASNENSEGIDTQPGTTIMVVGIIAQLVSGCVFAVFLGIVLPRGWAQIRASRPVLLICVAVVVSTLMMIIRGFYRSVELVQGWEGYVITHEVFVIALDAALMVVAMGGLALLNPGALLSEVDIPVQESMGRFSHGLVAGLFRRRRGAELDNKLAGAMSPATDDEESMVGQAMASKEAGPSNAFGRA